MTVNNHLWVEKTTKDYLNTNTFCGVTVNKHDPYHEIYDDYMDAVQYTIAIMQAN
jgi:hypothetical protein